MSTPKTEAEIILMEKIRITSILRSPEGQANPELAQELALFQSLDAEAACSILAKAPAAKQDPYTAFMNAHAGIGITGNPATPGQALGSDVRAQRSEELRTSMTAFNSYKGYSRHARGAR